MNSRSNGTSVAVRVVIVIAATVLMVTIFLSTSVSENSSLRRWVPFVDAPMCERVFAWSERAEDYAGLWIATYQYEIQGINPDFTDILSDINLAIDWLESNPPPGARADVIYQEYLTGLHQAREFFQTALDTSAVVDEAFVANIDAITQQFRWGVISDC